MTSGDPDVRPASRNPLVRFQQGFERRFEAVRSGYRGLLGLWSAQSRQG